MLRFRCVNFDRFIVVNFIRFQRVILNRLYWGYFTVFSSKIESLYRNDAARQVEAAQRNVLADYGELYQLRQENKILSDTNENLE